MELNSKPGMQPWSFRGILLKQSHLYICLLIIYLLIAIISMISSALDSAFRGTEVDLLWIIHLAFFYFSPLVIWLPLVPLIKSFAKRFPLFDIQRWKSHLLGHMLFALSIAPVIRILSIIVDFNVKSWFNLIDTSPWKIISDVWFVAFTTTPRAFYTYLFILLAFSIWNYYFKTLNGQPKTKEINDTSPIQQMITVRNGLQKVILDLNLVYWISVQGNYIQFHTTDKVYQRRGTLTAIEASLSEDIFFRIHRSALVNREAVSNWQHWRRGEYLLQLKNEKTVTSSRGYRKNMLRLIDSFEPK